MTPVCGWYRLHCRWASRLKGKQSHSVLIVPDKPCWFSDTQATTISTSIDRKKIKPTDLANAGDHDSEAVGDKDNATEGSNVQEKQRIRY